ncbi:MAG: glycosyltransferase [Candidatus Bathyarchaeota archaeon]|nr:glycosyltransferase [Candidatus Bathyarchaeota archaeon]
MNIVVLASVPWDFLWQRPQHIASGLAKRGHQVIYFENPTYVTLTKMVSDILKGRSVLIEKVEENVWVAKVYLPPFRGRLSWLKNWLFQRFFVSTLTKLDFKLDVAVFYLLDFFPLIKPIKSMNAKIAFDYVDDILSFPEFAHNKYVKIESELIESSTCIFATSKVLCDKLSKHNVPYSYLPNAMDFDHFYPASTTVMKLDELPNLKHPVIGFIGAFLEWVDDDLVCKLAETHPEYSILLVGPVHAAKPKFEKYPNIVMVGTKPYSVLPSYLSNMDVCLIPFKINNITLASNPIKMYEYLAAGKPVVSTALPEVVRNAEGIVYVGKNYADFIRKVELAVAESALRNEKVMARRLEFAKNNSWENRVLVIEKFLMEAVGSIS